MVVTGHGELDRGSGEAVTCVGCGARFRPAGHGACPSCGELHEREGSESG